MVRNKVFELNRKDYNRIRKMDHNQMSDWAVSVYRSGFEDGKESESGNALTIEQVRKVLLGMKGFGEKRADAVCEELNRVIAGKFD